MLTKITIIIIGSIIVYLVGFHFVKEWILGKIVNADENKNNQDFYDKYPSAKKYIGDEHNWEPTYNLEHRGLKVFNIPFVPEKNEIFYIENEYDKESNLFIEENIDLIKEVLASRGFTFVYLPSIKVSKEMVESMISYYTANPNFHGLNNDNFKYGLRSDFLLDYLVYPESPLRPTANEMR